MLILFLVVTINRELVVTLIHALDLLGKRLLSSLSGSLSLERTIILSPPHFCDTYLSLLSF